MREIPLTQGRFAIVDDADYELVSQFKWHVEKKKNQEYAARCLRLPDGRWTRQGMHRLLTNAPPGMEVDHKNGNGCDNRQENMRIVSHMENSRGHRKQRNNASGFRGVFWDGRCQKWYAQICHNKKHTHIGYFETAKEAALAFDDRARVLGWPEEGLNFPRFQSIN